MFRQLILISNQILTLKKGQRILGYDNLTLQNIINRNEIFDLIFKISMSRASGNDLWIYQPILTLLFDDGSKIIKKFDIDVIRENQNHSFVF